ncbi:sensor histidine kinase [Streptomyces sp. BI20]|uniref:sensor histidine kinase n=1 Tax=Streptomyces sp. BI20 TaxID=3403460 RepID=UPI003C786C71
MPVPRIRSAAPRTLARAARAVAARVLPRAAAGADPGNAERPRPSIPGAEPAAPGPDAGVRLDIAAELHDVITHHLTALAVQAGLARYVLDSDPATSRASLDAVTASAEEALAELRRMARVLAPPAPVAVPVPPGPLDGPPVPGPPGHGRYGLGPWAPAPGVARLPELLRRLAPRTSPPVAYRVTGVPYPLPAGLDLCVYRTVHQALTELRVGCDPTRPRSEVHLAYHDEGITLVVSAPPAADRRDPATCSPGAQRALIGMRARATIYDGTLTVEPEGPPEAAGAPEIHRIGLTLPVPGPHPAGPRTPPAP